MLKEDLQLYKFSAYGFLKNLSFFDAFQNVRRPLNLGCISEKISSRVMASGLSAESQMKTVFIAFLAPLMGVLADHVGIGSAIIILSCLTLLVFPLIKVH